MLWFLSGKTGAQPRASVLPIDIALILGSAPGKSKRAIRFFLKIAGAPDASCAGGKVDRTGAVTVNRTDCVNGNGKRLNIVLAA
jgi:hypothetical protein